MTTTHPHQGNTTTNTETGPTRRPWVAALRSETMRVYLLTVPWVWLASASTGALVWSLTGQADHYQSVRPPVCAGQEGCVPQSSPSPEGAK